MSRPAGEQEMRVDMQRFPIVIIQAESRRFRAIMDESHNLLVYQMSATAGGADRFVFSGWYDQTPRHTLVLFQVLNYTLIVRMTEGACVLQSNLKPNFVLAENVTPYPNYERSLVNLVYNEVKMTTEKHHQFQDTQYRSRRRMPELTDDDTF